MSIKKWSIAVVLLITGALIFEGCASSQENRNPVGETFPRVVGESLDGPEFIIPDSLNGKPAVLLVGYAQDAQFDADRWLMGLLQSKIDIVIKEVPTIEGLMAGMFAGTIDKGMRKGIPKEDWASVVTVYGDAGPIVKMTGNTNPNNIRVLLLDGNGKVVWFHDRGYSARVMLELKVKAESLAAVTK
ncbi:MAG: hypothetical protein ACI97A_001251 [Planctomycetota bacterium]|jgi:hypothetical protein